MRLSRKAALLTCAALLLTATACSEQEPEPEDNYAGAYLYGTDGNMSNSFGGLFKEEPGTLTGMKGTIPMTELNSDFVSRVHAIHPGLNDFIFTGETYDAVVISAIAAEQARTTDPKTVAKFISGVTAGGAVCRTVSACLKLARRGENLAYRGVTVRYGFSDVGEPATASYATQHFGATNQIDSGKTEFISTGNERNATSQKPPKATSAGTDGPLVFGSLLPLTGGLSFAKDPMLAGAALAIKEINAAGGVLGKNVEWRTGDDGTSIPVAINQIKAHKAAGVHVLIGPGGSGVALGSLETAVEAGLIVFSPSNTSAKLSSVEDSGLYFRTAPSDILQARAVADIILRDGLDKIAIVSHNDAYGLGLLEGVRAELTAGGLTDVVAMTYEVDEAGAVVDPAQLAAFAAELARLQPDGVLMIGYDDSADFIRALMKAELKIRR